MAKQRHAPVNNDLAQACVKNYHAIFKGCIDKRILAAFTSDVVFDRAQLIAWLSSLSTDSVKVSMGIYTPDFVAKYPTAKVNRLTTFITPYNSGSSNVLSAPDPDNSAPVDPPPPADPGDFTFNLGELTP
jgi:hypothetical protein